jgi:hypothetical protein
MPAHRFAGERREQQMRMAVASRGRAVDVGKAMALFASATIAREENSTRRGSSA